MKAGSRDAVDSVANWASSSEFLRTSRPEITRVDEEEGVYTVCEKNEWVAEYTENFSAHRALFEFAAMRWLRFNNFDETIRDLINNFRNEMNNAFNGFIDEIIALPEGIRCVGAPVQCPSGHTRFEPFETETITREPCRVNRCFCPAPQGRAAVSEYCLVDGFTEGCDLSVIPMAWHPEPSPDGLPGLYTLAEDQPFCNLGQPVFNPQERNGFHNRERCRRDACDDGAGAVCRRDAATGEEVCVCELQECPCETGLGVGTLGAECPANRRDLPPGLFIPGYRDHCRNCDGVPSEILQQRVLFRTEWFRYNRNCLHNNLPNDFRLSGCNSVNVDIEGLVLPISLDRRSFLEFTFFSDECDEPSSSSSSEEECSFDDKISVILNGRTIRTIQQLPHCRDGCTSTYRLDQQSLRSDARVNLRIRLESENTSPFAHPRLRIAYVGGNTPLIFNGPDGEARTCGVVPGTLPFARLEDFN